MIELSYFPHLLKPDNYQQKLLTVDQAFKFFSHYQYTGDKNAVPLYSGAVYGGAVKRRANENVTAMSAVVLDFDNGGKHPAEKFTLPDDHTDNLEGLLYFFHSTFSNTRSWRKWRLVLPLDRHATLDEWPCVCQGVIDLLGGPDSNIDYSCFELSRSFFMPSCPIAYQNDTDHGCNQGEPVKVERLLELSQGIPFAALVLSGTPGTTGNMGRNAKLKSMVAASLDAGDSLHTCMNTLSVYDQTNHTPPLFTDESDPQMKGHDPQSNVMRFVNSVSDSINRQRKRQGLPLQYFSTEITAHVATSRKVPGVTLFESAADFMVSKTKIDYLVRKLFELTSLTSFTGPSGQYKSFVAIDIACHVVTGRDWDGRAVTQGDVLYLAGEGRTGIMRRVKAWTIANGLMPEAMRGFHLSKNTLIMDGSNIADIVSEMEGKTIAAIFVDTTARHLAGHENDAKDMNAYINAVTGLASKLNATAFMMHHTGHDQARGRGSTAYYAALDCEVMCNKGTLTFSKMKDDEAPEPIEFKLASVEIGRDDETGEPINSAVVEYGERSTAHKIKSFTANERDAIKALINASSTVEAIQSEDGRRGALVGNWRKEYREIKIGNAPDISHNTIKMAFNRSAGKLLDKGIVVESGHARFLVSEDHQADINILISTNNMLKGTGYKKGT